MYQSQYKPFAIDWSRYPGADPRKAKAAQGQSDFLRFLGTVAPAAGGLVGGTIGALAGGAPAGFALGAGIGGGAGSLLGAGLNYGAAQTTQPYDEKDIERQARLQAAMSFFGRGRG